MEKNHNAAHKAVILCGNVLNDSQKKKKKTMKKRSSSESGAASKHESSTFEKIKKRAWQHAYRKEENLFVVVAVVFVTFCH